MGTKPPLVASLPITPEPGATSWPSSANTFTPGLIWNRAVSAPCSRVATEEPMPPSVEPIASTKRMSPCSSKPRFTSALHITPLETMLSTEEMS